MIAESDPFPLRSQFNSSVLANESLCREHYRLVLGLPTFPVTVPGQFIQISCRDLDLDYNPACETVWEPGIPVNLAGQELMSPLAMLRRPFSLAGRRDTPDGVELDIIHRVIGVGTGWLSRLKPRDHVFLLGPLGNWFKLPPVGATAIMVGGGVGIPPMLYLAKHLANQDAVAFCGVLSRDLLPLTILPGVAAPSRESAAPIPNIREFWRYGIPSVISTDDGSYGFGGFVTQALERYLDSAGARPAAGSRASFVIYTCGPEPMMKRVAAIATERGIECQIAVERAMACGMGTCQSCVIRTRKPAGSPVNRGKDWMYRLACTDGPVFTASELLW